MTKNQTGLGMHKVNGWTIEKPFLKMPKIKGTKIIEGVKYYLGEKGRMFVAEVFDRMFKRNY